MAEAKKFDIPDIVKTTLILFIITVATALLLGGVYELTKDQIAGIKEEKRVESMAQVMPGADNFEEIEAGAYGADSITKASKDGELIGCCVELRTNGFGGDISLMVGVGTNGAVTGVRILDHSETAGMGAKADDTSFLDQYIGRKHGITVKAGADTDIDAITAATITTKAVTNGINSALEIAAEIMD